MQIINETKRFLLREIVEADMSGIFELDSDPEVHKYLGNHPITNMEEAKSTIDYIQGQYKEYGIGRWAIIDKATEEFVGWGGLKYETVVRQDMDYYDLGYRLKRKFWGKGIATEVSLRALDFGFQTMNLNEIFAGAHIENAGSNNVLRKVGLNFLETFEYDGEPHHWYGLTKHDWQIKNNIV